MADYYIQIPPPADSAIIEVNGQLGPIVTLTAVDVGADPAGTAQTLVGDKYVRSTRFAIISSGTSGTVTLPASSIVVLDDFGGTVDALVTQVSGGKPTLQSAQDALGAIIATTFNSAGNWVFSGTPSAYPVAIIYRVTQKLSDFDSTSADIWGVPTLGGANSDDKVKKSGDTMTGTLYNDVSFAIQGGTTGNYVSLIAPTLLGSNTSLTLPEGSGTLLSTVTYAQVTNKDLAYNSVYTTAPGLGYVQLDPSGSTGNSRARLVFNNTGNNDYTFPNATGTVALTSALGAYVLKVGDTMTGPLEINGTSGNFSGVLVGNSDTAGTSQVTCGNGVTSIASMGATNSTFSSPLAGPNQGFTYSLNGWYAITNNTDGFNWVQAGSNVASIKNDSFTVAADRLKS